MPVDTETWEDVQPPENQRDPHFNFSVRNAGESENIQDDVDKPISYLGLFLTPAMLTEIVRQTNHYARQFLAQENTVRHMQQHRRSRYRLWPQEGITVAELKAYLGLLFAMGLVKKKKLNDYWSTNPVLNTPCVRSAFMNVANRSSTIQAPLLAEEGKGNYRL